jgi:putative tricarboxylic transport membrane protein
VLGLVIGSIFERYLYISTELYGWAWLLRPVVLVILVCVAWALYRPLSQIVLSLVHELRQVRSQRMRVDASAAFTLQVVAVIVAAIVSARDWPQAAKIVPLTACYMALVAAGLNLVNELFGRPQDVATRSGVDGGVRAAGPAALDFLAPDFVRLRATHFFLWLAAFIGIIAVIGFVPAIPVFVFAYMCFGFGERWVHAIGFALATAILCWVVFDWALAVVWPHSLLGDAFPDLRARVGLI